MAFWNRKKNTAPVAATSTFPALNGRLSGTGIPTTIPGYKSRTTDLLCALRREPDAYRAIELISEQHPDASMSVQSYIRLANNGHQMEIFYPGSDDRNEDAQSMWTVFSQTAGGVNVE